MWPQPDTLRLHLRERSPPPVTTTTASTTTTTSVVASASVVPSSAASSTTASNDSTSSTAAKTTAAAPTSAASTSTVTTSTTAAVTTKCTPITTTSAPAVTKTAVATPSTTKSTSAPVATKGTTANAVATHQIHGHTSPHFRLTPPFSSPAIFVHNTSTCTRTSTTTTTTISRATPTGTTTTGTTTHLSPWTGSSTFTSSSGHKKNSPQPDSRLVVLGAPAVGKSALVVRLLTGRFIWEYDPTLEAAYRHHTTVDDDTAVMDILDTAGQEDGTNVGDAHARWGDGFVLVFSLTDRRSFGAIAAIHATLAAAKQTPNFSCVIVANKTDLGHLAEVNEDEASELAAELGASLFLTSACDGGPAIHAAFSELHRDVVRRRWTRRRRSSAKTVIEGFYKMFSR